MNKIYASLFPPTLDRLVGADGSGTAHTAYSIVFPVIVNVSPCEYETPEPFAAVFQPAKMYPVFAKTGEPEFPNTVMVEPEIYGEDPSIGIFPLVLVLPLYDRVYVAEDAVFGPYLVQL